MKSYEEILTQRDDGAIALDVFDQGFPKYLYESDPERPGVPRFAAIFLNLMRLDSAIVSNGFSSIFDQHLAPWELESHEAFLEEIGAIDFLDGLRKCKKIYFGATPLPEDDDEWGDFQSVIWSDPEGEESTSFDEASKIAERAFYGEGYPASGYIHLHVLIGRYLRQNLKAMLHPEDLKN